MGGLVASEQASKKADRTLRVSVSVCVRWLSAKSLPLDSSTSNNDDDDDEKVTAKLNALGTRIS